MMFSVAYPHPGGAIVNYLTDDSASAREYEPLYAYKQKTAFLICHHKEGSARVNQITGG